MRQYYWRRCPANYLLYLSTMQSLASKLKGYSNSCMNTIFSELIMQESYDFKKFSEIILNKTEWEKSLLPKYLWNVRIIDLIIISNLWRKKAVLLLNNVKNIPLLQNFFIQFQLYPIKNKSKIILIQDCNIHLIWHHLQLAQRIPMNFASLVEKLEKKIQSGIDFDHSYKDNKLWNQIQPILDSDET